MFINVEPEKELHWKVQASFSKFYYDLELPCMGSVLHILHSGQPTWNLTRGRLKKIVAYREPLFRFHVRFPECSQQTRPGDSAATCVKDLINNSDLGPYTISHDDPDKVYGPSTLLTKVPKIKDNMMNHLMCLFL